jgi:putative FmdB family regulatory protein
MPIYDYQCRSCGEEFELLVLKGTVAECPSCQSQDLEQLLSGFSVSTEAMTKARVKAARSRYMSSSTYKDKQVAEMEEIKEHSPQSFTEIKKK